MTDCTKVLNVLANNHELTCVEISRKAGISRGVVADAIKKLDCKVMSHTDKLGVTRYSLPSPVGTIEKPGDYQVSSEKTTTKPRKPFTPNPIAGAYFDKGNLVIKLDRVAHAKSITLSPDDIALLMAIGGKRGG